jgi:hypothetical protein
MILETFTHDGEWHARQVDFVKVTRRGIVKFGLNGSGQTDLDPDMFVFIEVSTDTRQPLRTIVDNRKAGRKRSVPALPEKTLPNKRGPGVQSRFIDPPEID